MLDFAGPKSCLLNVQYERTMALELLKTGHPDAPRKVLPPCLERVHA